MLLADSPKLTPGVWGPFYSALYPGLWLMEGGQSSSGSLLEHVIHSHPAKPQVEAEAKKQGVSPHKVLASLLENMAKEAGEESVCSLSKSVNVWPDYHGNRSPLADPTMTGSVVGLTLAIDLPSLAIQYLATVQALCYGTRHILDQLSSHGHPASSVAVCGGLAKSPLFLQTQADVLGKQVAVEAVEENHAVNDHDGGYNDKDHSAYMGQFLQGGNFGCFVSYFF